MHRAKIRSAIGKEFPKFYLDPYEYKKCLVIEEASAYMDVFDLHEIIHSRVVVCEHGYIPVQELKVDHHVSAEELEKWNHDSARLSPSTINEMHKIEAIPMGGVRKYFTKARKQR